MVSGVMSCGRYQYVVSHPWSPRTERHFCLPAASAADPIRRSISTMSVAVATLARTPRPRNSALIRWATARAADPAEIRHCSASALGKVAIRAINQLSRCPAYGGVPINVS